MSTPRRAVLRAWADTPLEALEQHLVLEAQPRPEPSGDEVVVAVRAASVGWVDLVMASGHYQHAPTPPYVPGMEWSGDVVAVGPEVERWRPGDRVYADGLLTGPRSSGPHQGWGGLAAWTLARERSLRRVPDTWSHDEAAAFLGSYETAWHGLVARGRLQAGETVLIHGASGATGLAAVHLAKALGARVIATGRTPEKNAVVQAEGADHVLPTTDFVQAVRDLGGADVVWDGVGGAVTTPSLRAARFGARILLIGWASTPLIGRSRGRGGGTPNQIPTNLVLMKSLDVLGCPAVISAEKDPTLRPARQAGLDALVAAGTLRPRVARTYAFDDLLEAFRAKWSSQLVGAHVVHPLPPGG